MRVTLPRAVENARPEAPRLAESVVAPGHRRRILIVDDNQDGAETLAMFLDTLGCETIVVYDAPGALRLLGEQQVDAAVLDIGLPGMDGYELAAELRARLGDRVPVLVALTGYVQASDHERAMSSGFHAHLSKPVDPARLLATLEELINSG